MTGDFAALASVAARGEQGEFAIALLHWQRMGQRHKGQTPEIRRIDDRVGQRFGSCQIASAQSYGRKHLDLLGHEWRYHIPGFQLLQSPVRIGHRDAEQCLTGGVLVLPGNGCFPAWLKQAERQDARFLLGNGLGKRAQLRRRRSPMRIILAPISSSTALINRPKKQ